MLNPTSALQSIALATGLLAAAGFAIGQTPAVSMPEKSDLFRAGEGGYRLYRIPGIVATKSGTLLAYCEARKNDRTDWGVTDVYLRRSTDGGKSWEPARKLIEAPAVPKNPAAVAKGLGHEGEITVNNPVAIADPASGAVHFLYCMEYNRCYYVRSEDDGKSFSAPVDLTPVFDRFRPEYDWKVLATGPGHGIRLRNGRLVVPVWLSTGAGGGAHRPSCIATIYSDDGGKSWNRGAIVAGDPNPPNPSETAAVELSNGNVLLNLRQEGKEHRRAVTVSPDGSRAWSPIRLDPALPEPVCMAGLLRVPEGRGKASILFSNPHNPETRERKNLTVKLSPDDCATWPFSRVIEPGPSGYSDLAAVGNTVYCFYERGALQGSAFKTEALTIARFDLSWLRRPE